MPKETFLKITKAKQRRILNAAKIVFSKFSYQKVTIDRIVEEADIPKGSFYQYFKNKEDLFTYMFFDLGKNKETYLKTIIDQFESDNFIDLLFEIDEKGYEFENQTKTKRILRQKFYMECPQEVMRKITMELLNETYDVFHYAIEKFQRNGIIKKDINTSQAGFIIASCFYNRMLFPNTVNKEVDFKETITNALQYLFFPRNEGEV